MESSALPFFRYGLADHSNTASPISVGSARPALRDGSAGQLNVRRADITKVGEATSEWSGGPHQLPRLKIITWNFVAGTGIALLGNLTKQFLQQNKLGYIETVE